MPTNFKETHVGREVVDIVFGEGLLDVLKGKKDLRGTRIRVRFNANTDDEHLHWYDAEGHLMGAPKARRSLFLKGEEPEICFPVICEPLDPALTFPVHSSEHNWRKTVPLALVEKCREQIQANHHQSLELLAERGGLSSVEIWLAYDGRDLRLARHCKPMEVQKRLDWIIANWRKVDIQRGKSAAEDRIKELEQENWTVVAENELLRTALHDTICRPMGQVPESAEPFYDVAEADRAEARRPKHG